MTAVDVDALDKLREAATGRLWSALENVGVLDHSNDPERDRADLDAEIAASLEPLIAEVRRGRALREAVEDVAYDLRHHVIARGKPQGGSYDDGVNRAQAAVASDLLAALAVVDGGEQ